MQKSSSETHSKSIVGLHHISSVVTDFERTLRFYMGTLDLNLVGLPLYVDGRKLMHFYCGKQACSPTSLLTFVIDETAKPGAIGSGHISAVTFSVPAGSLWFWQHRLERAGAQIFGRAWSFGKEHLCFCDPDGLQLAMVEDDPVSLDSARPQRYIDTDYEILRISAVEIQVEGLDETARFLIDALGFTRSGREGSVSRFSHEAMSRVVTLDVISIPNDRSGAAGSGIPHDLVWRVPDEPSLHKIAAAVQRSGLEVTTDFQTDHFKAIYFHDPCGIRFAVALDGTHTTCTEPC